MQFKTTKIFLLFFYSLNLGFMGCVNLKDVIYLNKDIIDINSVNNNYQLTFKPDDLLQIVVSSDDLSAVQPFNLPVYARQTNDFVVGQPQLQAYLVDSSGYIQFPVLGKIKVGGLTRVQLINNLRNYLDPTYVKNPIINIIITNFKVTVQGDVARPGTFTVPNERLSIFDALGLAGDLNITGNRSNVLIIREENNLKKEYRIDLTSKKTLTSPAYYLQQNDIVYVEPNKARSQDAIFNRNSGLIVSIASVFISLLAVLTR